MRKVQRTASCGRECANAVRARTRSRWCSERTGKTPIDATGIDSDNCSAAPVFVSGCEAGAVFFGEVAQHFLFAQQSILQVFCSGASLMMQLRTEARSGAVESAAPSANAIAILVSTLDS